MTLSNPNVGDLNWGPTINGILDELRLKETIDGAQGKATSAYDAAVAYITTRLNELGLDYSHIASDIAAAAASAATASAAAASAATASAAAASAATAAAAAPVTDANVAGVILSPQTKAALDGTYAGNTAIQYVFKGDSLTYGVGVMPNMPLFPYPAQATAGIDARCNVVNVGTGGQRVDQMIPLGATEVDALYNASTYAKNICILLGGINDLYYMPTSGKSTTDIYNDIKTYHLARRAAGFKTVAVTILPATGNTPPPGTDANRLAVNSLIVANWATFADALADAANDPVFATAGVTTDLTYYFTDAVHLNVKGYRVLANVVRAALERLNVARTGHTHEQFDELSRFRSEATNNGNVRIGWQTAASATTSTLLTAVGQGAAQAVTTATALTAIGQGAAKNVTTGINNTYLGAIAGFTQVTGQQCTAVGSAAGYSGTASDQTAIGYRALFSNGAGVESTAVGSQALYAGTTVSQAVAIGKEALRSSNANYNTALGYQAGYAPGGVTANATVAGVRNVFAGWQSGQAGSGATSDSVALGASALVGVNGVAIGSGAVCGASAVAIGKGTSATGAGSMAIGVDNGGAAATTAVANEIKLGTALHTVNVLGKVKTAAGSTTQAGLNVAPGVAPTAPVNGDVWATTAGVFTQVNGVTGQLSQFVASGTATLVAGTVTVANTSITANSIIRVWNKTIGGTPGAPFISAKTAGTSFTITSTNAADTSVIYYEILSY